MTAEAATRASHQRLGRMLAWVTIARGCLALLLGFALLLHREGTSESLATFMGLYWLTGGILAVTFHRWSEHHLRDLHRRYVGALQVETQLFQLGRD